MTLYINNTSIEQKLSYGSDTTPLTISSATTLAGNTSFYILNVTGANQNVSVPSDVNSSKGDRIVVSVLETSVYAALLQTTNTTLLKTLTLYAGESANFIYNGAIWIFTGSSNDLTEGATLFSLFNSTANSVNNAFLATENIATSDNLPSIAPITGIVSNFTFSNTNTSPVGSFEFRINHSDLGIAPNLIVPLVGTQTQVTAISLSVNRGDRLNCYITGASGVGKPLVKLFI